jgi:hypothetical protein
MVDPDLAYQYLPACVDLAQKLVWISNIMQEVKVYDISLDTVGQWADDEQLEIPVDEKIGKGLLDV